MPAELRLAPPLSPDTTDNVEAQPRPLLVDVKELSKLIGRSIPSLFRDDSAARLPAALKIGGSKRWRYSDICRWVQMGCPSRARFEALSAAAKK